MTCPDCEYIWILNRNLNASLAKTMAEVEIWQAEVIGARAFADKKSSAIIRNLRTEIESLKREITC